MKIRGLGYACVALAASMMLCGTGCLNLDFSSAKSDRAQLTAIEQRLTAVERQSAASQQQVANLQRELGLSPGVANASRMPGSPEVVGNGFNNGHAR